MAVKARGLSADLLPLPARYGARIAARIRLEQVLTTAADLVSPPGRHRDPEAVHQFRVAARRLRNTLRDFKTALDDTLGGGTRRRLAEISDLAGEVRDCDVQAIWLGARHRGLVGPAREAARQLARDLERDRVRALHPLQYQLLERLPKVAARIARGLRHYHLDGDLDAPETEPTMRYLLGIIMLDHSAKARAALHAVGPRGAGVAMHHARLRIKRLRDLLGIMTVAVPATRAPQRTLGRLQNSAGVLHDLQVLRLRTAAHRPARVRTAGDIRLLAFLDARIEVALRTTRGDFRRPATEAMLNTLDGIARDLTR